MAKVEKQFDAVQMMRSIRDRMNEEIRDMTFEEEQAYIRQRLNDEAPGNLQCRRQCGTREDRTSRRG